MEFMQGIILVIVILAALVFFKGAIRKTAKHTEAIVDTNINESRQDLIRRSIEAYENIIEEFGEDFLTPEEVYAKLHKKRKKTVQK